MQSTQVFHHTMYNSGWKGHNGAIDITNVVDNRGEDLRFPISSSSGFSSPFAFTHEEFEGALQKFTAGLFFIV